MMIPDRYTQEKFAHAHRQQLHREAEIERMLGESPEQSSHPMRHMVGKLRSFLIAVGTRLKQLEQPRKQIAVD